MHEPETPLYQITILKTSYAETVLTVDGSELGPDDVVDPRYVRIAGPMFNEVFHPLPVEKFQVTKVLKL